MSGAQTDEVLLKMVVVEPTVERGHNDITPLSAAFAWWDVLDNASLCRVIGINEYKRRQEIIIHTK